VANPPNYITCHWGLQDDANPPLSYTWKDNIIQYKDRLVLSPTSALEPMILNELHSSALVGHSIFQNTYSHDHHYFWGEGMKKEFLTFFTECDIFQQNNSETVKTPITLHPLPIPASIWTDISMEFIVGLPKSGNKSVIMVLVNPISKYVYFGALPHPFMPAMVASFH
jgi:hypothetical protein